jgi:hypothetical protein
MADDRRVEVKVKLLPTTLVAIDAQCDRLYLGRVKAIEMVVEHGVAWLESLPDALRTRS